MSLQQLMKRWEKHRPKQRKQLFAIFFFAASFVSSGDFAARKKQESNIDWKSPYYQSQFGNCKKLHPLNPVEAMKAQGVAATMFRRCGPRIIARIGTEVYIPVLVFPSIGELFCWIVTLFWTFEANDGSLTIPVSTRSQVLFDFFHKLSHVVKQGNFVLVARNPKETFRVPVSTILDFANETLPCMFPSKFVVPSNGDYMKHVVEYWLKMLRAATY